MQIYKKPRSISHGIYSAGTLVTTLPKFAEGEPPVGESIYRWYDPQGNYLGWSDAETGRKYLYGGLYYKTKGKYSVSSKRLNTNHNGKKYYITERPTNTSLCLYAILRALLEDELIDENDKLKTATIGMQQATEYGWNIWNMDSFPDNYKLLPADYRDKVRQMREDFVEQVKQQTIKEFQYLINAELAQKQHIDTHQVDISNF